MRHQIRKQTYQKEDVQNHLQIRHLARAELAGDVADTGRDATFSLAVEYGVTNLGITINANARYFRNERHYVLAEEIPGV